MRIFAGTLAAIITLLSVSWVPSVGQATELTKQEYVEQRRFAYNNSLFVLYHEMAHLLFDQMQVPVLGREEDAADNLATWTLLNKGTEQADRVLTDAARGWFLSSVAYSSGAAESDYAAPHTLDKQRAYQIVCMMVGKDMSAFRSIANKYHLSYDRQESCSGDWTNLDYGLRGLLQLRSSQSEAGSDVSVVYHVAGGALDEAADAFKSSGVFDQVADELRDKYRLAKTVRLNAKRCGEANAFYNPDKVEIIFCYELMADYMNIYAANMPKRQATSNKAKDGQP